MGGRGRKDKAEDEDPPRKPRKGHKRVNTHPALIAVCRDVVRLVEKLYPTGKGEEKKKAAVALINAVVDLPFIGEQAEAAVIGAAIDAACALLNMGAGTGWRK